MKITAPIVILIDGPKGLTVLDDPKGTCFLFSFVREKALKVNCGKRVPKGTWAMGKRLVVAVYDWGKEIGQVGERPVYTGTFSRWTNWR